MNDTLLQLLENQASVNGRYSKLQRISTSPGGGGNFSLTFTAYDQVMAQTVVLKFDDPWVPEKYRHECFDREAAILAKFKGEPNVVQLFEGVSAFNFSVSLPGGAVLPIPLRFFSLEQARFSLFEYIQQPKKKYGPLRSLIYFREVCKGVQRLHAAKVCHRDLRPQNCFVMTGSYVVVGDLGTAKVLFEDKAVPSPMAIYHEPVGALTHTAPELLCCLDSNADIVFASDIYSLGAILFELFTKAELSGYLYSIQEITDTMIQPFSKVDDVSKRKQYFDASIGALEAACPLPNIEDIAPDGTVPESIRIRLNRLYKGLAALDYRKRMVRFDWVFMQIEIMTRILLADLVRTRRAQFKARRRAVAQVIN
ncbi:MAG: hypothetical protein A3H49_08700 [Nitrospirae bacterium RIFCSPLOWO2_02_FULL_62_14]|nr:MAG: hypothetical protein A3H49_08700 [Nitrospirae bacterium RIFCSPLOWO2_02_FULL_62_14]